MLNIDPFEPTYWYSSNNLISEWTLSDDSKSIPEPEKPNRYAIVDKFPKHRSSLWILTHILLSLLMLLFYLVMLELSYSYLCLLHIWSSLLQIIGAYRLLGSRVPIVRPDAQLDQVRLKQYIRQVSISQPLNHHTIDYQTIACQSRVNSSNSLVSFEHFNLLFLLLFFLTFFPLSLCYHYRLFLFHLSPDVFVMEHLLRNLISFQQLVGIVDYLLQEGEHIEIIRLSADLITALKIYLRLNL